MKGVELFVVVIVVATALGAIGYMVAPDGATGLQTFNSQPSQTVSSALVENLPFLLSLDDVFFDAEGDTLTYSASDPAILVEGNVLTFVPPVDLFGEYTITITASDGENTVAKPFTFILPLTQTSPESQLRGTLETPPAVLAPIAQQIEQTIVEEMNLVETTAGAANSSDATDSSQASEPSLPQRGLSETTILATNLSSCQTISNATPGTYTADTDLSATGTCLTITTGGVIIDCAGFTITFNTAGGTATSGITGTGLSNITIRNCRVIDNTVAGANNVPLRFTSLADSEIHDNIIQSNGTSTNHGILLTSPSNVSIYTNTIRSTGTSSDNDGIQLLNSAVNTTVNNNNVFAVGTSGIAGVALTLTTASSNALNNSITGNTIAPTGTSNVVGVQIAGTATNSQVNLTRITGNTISLAGGSSITNDDGIAVGANTLFINDTIIESNTVTLSDVLDEGIDLVTHRNNTQAHIASNTFTGPGYGIRVSRQNTHFKQNISTSNTINGQTIYYYGGLHDSPACPGVHTGNAAELNLIECNTNTIQGATIGPVFIYNVSFLVVDSINVLARGDQDIAAFGIYGAASNFIINRSTFSSFTGFDNSAFLVNVALNDFFVANNTFNITDGSAGGIAFDANPAVGIGNARIRDNTFFGNNTDDVVQLDGSVIVFSNNTVIVDDSNSQDAGLRNFADNINITNNTFTGIADENIIESIASNVTVADNYIIGEVTSNSFTDFSGANYNITNNIFIDNGTTDYLAMLEISGIFYNNSVFKTGTQGFHLLLAGGSNLRVVNNTLVMAFTPGNEYGGIEVETNNNVTIADNHINISGRGSGETGPLSAVFVDRGREITIANNTFILNSTGNASAIAFEGGNNSVVTNNSMTITSTGSITYGVFLTLRPTTFISQNNTFANNTITVNGTSRTKGFLLRYSSNNTIENNSIQVNSSGDDNRGIEINSSSFNNTIRSNTIIVDGIGAHNYGIHLNNGSNRTTVSSNNISTDGTSRNYGILINTTSHDNTMGNNRITTSGSLDANHGIRIDNVSNRNVLSGNTVITGGSEWGQGISVLSSEFNNVTYNNVTANSTGAFNYGIVTDAANYTIVSYNNITTNGTSQNQGMKIEFGSNHSTVTDNTIQTDGTGASNVGIVNAQRSNNNTFLRNNISTRGTTSHGIRCAANAINGYWENMTITTFGAENYGINFGTQQGGGCTNATFNNTFIYNTTFWLSSQNDSNSTLWNTTFETPNGSINIVQNFSINGTQNITTTNLNVSLNNSFLNSTNLSALNTTARITLNGLNFTDPSVVVDFEDDGTFAACSPPTCNETSYAGGVFIFNVSSFTSYAASETTVSANDTCPGTITSSLALMTNLNGTALGGGNCIETTTPNIVIDCQGYTMTGDNASTAIFVNAENVTTENCVLLDWDLGIVYEITNDGLVQNNTINNSATDAILVHANNRTLIQHNRLNDTGSRGIAVTGQLFALNANNTIYNNTVDAQGSTCFFGGTYPHTVQNTVMQDNIGFNCSTAVSLGTSSAAIQNLTTYNSGSVSVSGAATATITNLIMHRGGGISITDSGVSATNVYIANATQGLSISNTSSFPATGTETAGMAFTNITILSEQPQWLSTSALQDPSNTLVNFTFGSNNGSVSWTGTYILPENSNVGDPLTGDLGFNETYNLTQLNSSALSFLNTSARISLFGLPFTTPQPLVDFEDDGTFISCTAPQCENSTYSSGNFTFDVLSFSGYAASETVSALSCPYNITADLTMTADQNCAGTVFVISADNVTLDCAGYNVYFDNASAGTNQGILSTAHNNVTIKNCFISPAPTSTNTSNRRGINALGSQNVTITNNTIRVNSTTVGNGILAQTDTTYPQSREITITNNTIIVNGTSNQNRGIHLISTSLTNTVANVTIANNSINARNTDNGGDIRTNRAANITVEDNVLLSNGTSFFNSPILSLNTNAIHIRRNNITFGAVGVANGAGVDLDGSVSNSTVVNNSIFTLGAGGRAFGVRIEFTSRNNTILNNTIRTGGGAENNFGITVTQEAQNNTISHNSIITNGTTNNIGIRLRFASGPDTTGNIVQDNIIVTDGSGTDNYGIMLEGVSNNTFVNNSIRTIGTLRDHGISIFGAASNSTFDRTVITTASTQSYAIAVDNSSFVQFANSRLVNNARWINQSNTSNNNFTNTTFETTQGSINLPATINISIALNATENNLNITLNRSFMNSTNLSPLNRSAIVTLNGLPFTDPSVLVDFEDDGTFAVCSSPACNETSYLGSVFVFNVSSFTSYASSETVVASACPVYVNTNSTLGANISCPATAIIVNTSNVVLDCAGYTINYSETTAGRGIEAIQMQNVTVNNCIVLKTNASVSNADGIYLEAVNDTVISNATVVTIGSNTRAIYITGTVGTGTSRDINVTNSNITSLTSGAIRADFGATRVGITHNAISSPQNEGINFQTNGRYFFINNNTITNAAGNGITLSSATLGAIVSNNTVTATAAGAGISLQGPNTYVSNNTAITGPTSVGNALSVTGSNATLLDNNGIATSAISSGISVVGSNVTLNNSNGSSTRGGAGIFIGTGASTNITANNIRAYSNSSTGLILFGNTHQLTNVSALSNVGTAAAFGASSQNSTILNLFLMTNNSWLTTGASSTGNNFTNTTFNATNGNILVYPQVTPPALTTVGLSKLNITLNNSYLNSTNLSFLNTSAQITLNGITFVDPRPRVDFEDDGIFANCHPPQCTEISYAGGVYVFNVSSFTSYAAQENLTLVINLSADKLDLIDPVARGGQLSYTIMLNNSGNGTAYNVTMLELYPAETSFVSGEPTPSGNDTFSVGELAPGASFVVNITVNVSSALANGTLINNTVNVSFSNDSGENFSFLDSELTTVLGAPVLVSIKSDTPDPVVRGSTLNYSILINNTGDDTAFNVSLTETYPAGVSFVTAQPTPTGNNTFAIGTLAPNESFVVNITVTVGANVANGTLLNNSVNASWRNVSGQQGGVSDSELTTVLGIAALTAVKTDTPDPVNNGSVLSYTITITNTGDEIAYNVTAVDGYPVNVSLTTTSPAPFSGNDTFVLGDLLPGASTTINITVTVDTNMTAGVLNNTVNATFTNVSGVNETTSAFQATTVTTPGVPAAPAGGGGGGGSGSVGFRAANITREQPTQTSPITFPTVATPRAPPVQTQEQITPEQIEPQNTTLIEQVEVSDASTAQTQIEEKATQKHILAILGTAFATLLVILLLVLLMRMTNHAEHMSKPGSVKQSKPKEPLKTTQKPIVSTKSRVGNISDLKKLDEDILALNKMLGEFDKKFKR